MENLVLLVPISMFAMVFGIVYFGIITDHREKIAMIEAGMNPSEASKNEKSYNKLRAALLFVFVPLGILIGRLMFPILHMEAEICQLVFAFLFGGLGLTVTYFLEQTWLRKRDQNDLND